MERCTTLPVLVFAVALAACACGGAGGGTVDPGGADVPIAADPDSTGSDLPDLPVADAADATDAVDAADSVDATDSVDAMDPPDAPADAGTDSASADPGPAPTACNGLPALCDRRYDQVAYVTTHNAMSNADEGWAAPNQNHGIERQLLDGVRALMPDLWYGDGDATDPATVYLCHGICAIGNRSLADALSGIRTFLDAHPREVVTIIFESYVKAADVASVFEAAGLLPYLHVQVAGEPWPTLSAMVESGRRLVVFTDHDAGTPAWYHDVWAHAFETHWSAKTIDDFTCDPNRGDPANALFILNHFLTDPFALPALAATANANPFFLDRALQCQAARERLPNFLTVDFYDIGDVFDVASTLNGGPPRPQGETR